MVVLFCQNPLWISFVFLLATNFAFCFAEVDSSSPLKGWSFPVPPSGPRRGSSDFPPPTPRLLLKGWGFGQLPKYTPVPPSGPSSGGSDYPPPPPTSLLKDWRFGQLPKYTPIPPSGPCRGSSDYPPPPPPTSHLLA
ncbi:hypothetical protein OIU85_016348 [Salix viminalis]|uniref:Uncharacterized protein n=1 Tax=Salix viminalis TaxID=40686 RepID=A0A9Q0ZPP7_SALVM|nr:hypothetical protein OIU85_016348 [Salix viminalis]